MTARNRCGPVPVAVATLRTLGNGRAAEARLVQAEFADGRSLACVEKVFRPGWLTRLIYRTAFQAPFPYRDSRHAVEACYFRRRVAGAIVKACEPGARVAAPLYIRRDAAAGAWVLAAEWIRGRGPVPSAVQADRLRRRCKRSAKRPAKTASHTAAEIDELVTLMRRLENLFCESGLIGSGWQVCPRALVSTANLLKTESGWVVIDLESGIPAVLVSRYLAAGLKLRSLPLFDDLDAPRLRQWIVDEQPRLQAALGERDYRTLESDAERLIESTARWKQAEPAVARRRPVTQQDARRQEGSFRPRESFRQAYRDAVIDRWRQTGQVDESTAAALRSGGRGFGRLWCSGLLPGVGRFLRRLQGHGIFRARTNRFLRESRFRRVVWRLRARRDVSRWVQTGRLPQSSARRVRSSWWRYGLNAALSKCLPANVHRRLVDGQERWELAVQGFLLIASARYQTAYGRHLIGRSISRWEADGRIDAAESQTLQRRLSAPDVEEYLRGFSLHVGLKCLSPVLLPLKIGGVFLWLRTGDARFLLAWLALPMMRTTVTLWRMFASRRENVEHGEALLVGMVPVVGSLAYSVQMFASHRDLSCFLLRDAAAKAGQWLPVYGGKCSRTELWFIRQANYLIELVDIALKPVRVVSRWLKRERRKPKPAGGSAGRLTRWQRFVNSRIRKLQQREQQPLPTPASAVVNAESQRADVA